jgi:hypothetical protein
MSNYNVLLGIDVGLRGAICIFDAEEGEILNIYDMPTYYTESKTKTKSGKFRQKGHLDLDKLLYILEMPKHQGDKTLLVMEDVNAFPGQGVVAVGTLLEQKGILMGMGKALGYDIKLITPREWQKYFGIVPPKEIKGKEKRRKWLKNNSRIQAVKEFPDEWMNKFIPPDGDGRSDSSLIAKYTWKLLD